MPLFQKPARTPEEVERSRPLAVSPDEVAGFDEETWYARAYRGDDVPQLTVRAVLMGSALGFLLAFTNLYVGLKTGWGLGVAITACILSFSIWNALLKAGLAKTPMSILENNCMQSTASAAGYSTGSAMVSAIPALLMLTVTADNPGGKHLPWTVLAGWTACLSALGVFLAIPMKRNMINRERLKFPSGLAAAVTLQSLYSSGGGAVKKARALFGAALVSGLIPLLVDLKLRVTKDGRAPLLPDQSPIFDFLPGRGGHRPSDWTIVLDHKLVMIAAGALVGLRACLSMVLGSLLLAFVVGPAALDAGAAKAAGRAWRDIGVWIGAPMMVSAGVLAFAMQWRTIARAFRGIGGGKAATHADVEVPGSWFVAGTSLAAVVTIWIGHAYFQIPWHLGLLAVLLTFALSLVACRATGETDITPTGAMGKIMQLVYGVLLPQNAAANLMTASITGNASVSAADLLTDLKSGYLLGANPRRQLVAQMCGIVGGTIATVAGFYILVPDATLLTGGAEGKTPAYPAPAAQAWLAVAKVFEAGISTLHPMARQGIIWGLVIGAGLLLLETFLPKLRRFLPSATGVGLGFILPFNYPLSMLIGAVVAWAWTRRNKVKADDYLVPVSSGVIAGESIVGVVVAALNNFVLR